MSDSALTDGPSAPTSLTHSLTLGETYVQYLARSLAPSQRAKSVASDESKLARSVARSFGCWLLARWSVLSSLHSLSHCQPALFSRPDFCVRGRHFCSFVRLLGFRVFGFLGFEERFRSIVASFRRSIVHCQSLTFSQAAGQPPTTNNQSTNKKANNNDDDDNNNNNDDDDDDDDDDDGVRSFVRSFVHSFVRLFERSSKASTALFERTRGRPVSRRGASSVCVMCVVDLID